MTPRSLFRAVAIAELVTWTLLILGMLMKYVLGLGDLGVRVGGSIHGFVFLAYLVVTTVVAVNQRWSVGTMLLGWASAIVPYTTVPFEVGVARRGLLDGDWRRGPDGGRRGPLDPLLLAVVRRPVVFAAIGVVLVAAVFAVLLVLGPPVAKG